MGLFSAEYCCLCGAKAKLLRREKLGDKNYICAECREKCSEDVNWKKLDKESIVIHMQEVVSDAELIRNEFVETELVRRSRDREPLLCLDCEHGWWYLPNRERPIVFEFRHIIDYYVDISTSERERPDDSGRPGDLDRPGGSGRTVGSGRYSVPERPGNPGRRGPNAFELMQDLNNMMKHERRLPRPGPGREVDTMKFVLRLENHPYVDELELPLLKFFDTNRPHEVEDAYADARYLLELFDRCREKFQFADSWKGGE